MTYQQINWAINDAAMLAAESAFDAFGGDPAAELPTPEVAWDFLNTNVYGEGAIERPAALPEFMTRQFKHENRAEMSIEKCKQKSLVGGICGSLIRSNGGGSPVRSAREPVRASALCCS